MSQFAVLDDSNVVRDIIVADDLETAESVTGRTCVACDPTLGVTANYGHWSWDSESSSLINTSEVGAE